MPARLSPFALSVVCALAGAAGLDMVFGRVAEKHFLPATMMHDAVALGDGCVLVLGDSRTQVGVDASSLQATLRAGGGPSCVAQMGLGSVPVSGWALTLRRYLAQGRKPAVVLVGESVGSLLPVLDPPNADEFVGNRAFELAVSSPSDVATYYPGFPWTNLDRGIRFSLARTNACETYASLVWLKLGQLEKRVTGDTSAEPTNRFGAVADMQNLLGAFGEGAKRSLARFDGDWKHSPWFAEIESLTRTSGARLVVIELPMRSTYRREILESPIALRYRGWLSADLGREGALYLDLSATTSVSDADFGDGLHLDPEGAKRFSEELGKVVLKALAAH